MRVETVLVYELGDRVRVLKVNGPWDEGLLRREGAVVREVILRGSALLVRLAGDPEVVAAVYPEDVELVEKEEVRR